VARKIDGQLGDKYQLSAILGQGATGTVYAAKNVRSQRRVAIKSLHLRPGLDPGSPELLRFEQEARIAGAIESSHIAQVLDIEHDPATNLPFLVMELLRGEDLQSLLNRVGPLPADVALRITAQACAGLAAAHAARVIHRDIKPANIFLAKQEKGRIVVKILDFGIAKIRRQQDMSTSSQGLSAPAVSMTETGQMLGSPLFMSPEQVDGTRHVDERSDLFSLGVTLFTMLAGKAPHAEVKSLPMLLNRLVNLPPPPIRTLAHWVAPQVETFVQKASAFHRDDRFSTANDMLAALETILPNGTDLQEDMLVGIGEAPRAVIGAQIGSDPYARTEQVAVEPNPAPMVTVDPSALTTAATLQSAAPMAMAVGEPNIAQAGPVLESNTARNRNAVTIVATIVIIVLVAILIFFTR